MSNEAELKIVNLYKGKSIRQALNALEIMEAHVNKEILSNRIKLCGLNIKG